MTNPSKQKGTVMETAVVNYLRGVLPQFTYNQHNKVQGQPFLVQDLVAARKEQL